MLIELLAKEPTPIKPMVNIAYLTYLEKEELLLRDHAGEYVWIVGKDIKEYSKSLSELLEKAQKARSPFNNTIVHKIEKDPKTVLL
jgi:hypothetical protein